MKRILQVINLLGKKRNEINISQDSIEFITAISKSLRPENVLEIGCFNGYSALWFSLFAKNVITLEIDNNNIKSAKENFFKAGSKNIKIIEGDAKIILNNLKKKFEIIFIDGKKSEYKEYLELSLNLLSKNGLIFADNTISHKDLLKEFFAYLEKSSLYYKELNLGKGLIIISNKLL